MRTRYHRKERKETNTTVCNTIGFKQVKNFTTRMQRVRKISLNFNDFSDFDAR